MEVKLPKGAPYANSVADAPRNVGVESFAVFHTAGKAGKEAPEEATNQEDYEQKDILRDVLSRAADLLSIGDRGLKFEMVEDADLYQMQVVDMTDGRVVRKVPPDEIMKMITQLKEQISDLSDRVDVFA